MLYNEDCLETMARMDDESVHLVFADYPFNIQDGKDDYGKFIEDTSNEFYRILKEGGNLVVVNNPFNNFKYIHLFSKFVLRSKVALLRKGAFYVAWHLGYAHNEAYFLIKGNDIKFRWNGNRIPNQKSDKDFTEYENGNRTKAGWHPQAMPQELVTKWVGYLSNEGDTVYDPFTGSGTTWIACGETRNFIGSEFSEKYFYMAKSNYIRAMEIATQEKQLPLLLENPDINEFTEL